MEIQEFFIFVGIILNLQKSSPNIILFNIFIFKINLLKLPSLSIVDNSSLTTFCIKSSGYFISENNCQILFDISSSLLLFNTSINKSILSCSKCLISSVFCLTLFFYFQFLFLKF